MEDEVCSSLQEAAASSRDTQKTLKKALDGDHCLSSPIQQSTIRRHRALVRKASAGRLEGSTPGVESLWPSDGGDRGGLGFPVSRVVGLAQGLQDRELEVITAVRDGEHFDPVYRGWLSANQPDTFSLATLSFSGLAVGTTPWISCLALLCRMGKGTPLPPSN